MLHRTDTIREIVRLLKGAGDRELVVALEFIRSLTRED